MFPIQDQISAAAKANLEANAQLYGQLATKTLESIEKLINLNLAAVKASMEESSEATRQMLAAKDPQELMTLVGAQAKPNFDKVFAYNGHLANIANTAQAEFAKATEAQLSQASQKVSDLVQEATRNAPAGSENMVAIMRSMFGNAATGYEQFMKTSKQAAEMFGANLSAATGRASQVVEPAKG